MRELSKVERSQVIRSLSWAALFVFSLLFIFYGTSSEMVAVWSRSDTFAHGFLVFPIAIWLIWIKREHLWIDNVRPAPWVVLLMLAPAALWLLAWLVDVSVVMQLSLIALLITGCWAILGHRLIKVLIFPLFFLFFAVPMGEGLIPPMMEFTATSTIWLVKASGIPVYREGLHFSLPSGYWSVVEACSGVRYIIASVTVGTLYAYLTYHSLYKRVIFILVSAILPVFANTARAYMIVMLGHVSNMKIATGADHLLYGWVFFGIVIFALFWIGNFFREDELPPEALHRVSDQPGDVQGNAVLPLTTLFALLVAYLAPGYAHSLGNGVVLDPDDHVTMPAAAEGWRSSALSPWYWHPPSRVEGMAEAFYSQAERNVGVAVQYDVGGYRTAEVLGSSLYLAIWRSGSRLAGTSQQTISVDGETLVVDEGEILGVDRGLRVWSWYYVGGKNTINPYVGKVHEALGRIGWVDAGAYRIVIYTEGKEDPAAERRVLQGFLDEYGAALYQQLRQASAGIR